MVWSHQPWHNVAQGQVSVSGVAVDAEIHRLVDVHCTVQCTAISDDAQSQDKLNSVRFQPV